MFTFNSSYLKFYFLSKMQVPNDPDNDFVGSSQVARYAARERGVTSVTFTVNDDLVAETEELFYMRLEPLDPAVRVGAKNTLRVVIRANDDAYGVFSIDEVNSSDADAVPGQDIQPVTGTITFQAQQTEAEISLQIRHDASQYRFEEGPNSKTVTVDVTRGLDDEGQRSPFGNINHLVTLRYSFEVDVNGGATEPQDFEGTDGALTFQPMETRKTISFLIKDDNTPELEEYFRIRLFSLEGEAELVVPSVTNVIINANDNPSGILSFQATSDGERPLQRVNEDTFSSVTFQVHRYEGTFGEVTVQWEVTRDRGASVPVTEDIGPVRGTLVFADGQNEASITLTVVQDNTPEPAEMFDVNLIPNSVTGNAEVEGVTVARLLVEDSDNVYGTVEFGPGTDHALFTTQTPRTLRLSVTRSGGRERNLLANITVQYEDSYEQREEGDVLEASSETFVLPEGQDPVLVDFDLKASAFLSVGGQFTAVIESVSFEEPAPRFGSFNGPTIGEFRPQTTVLVQAAQANGETGFFNVTNQFVDEPEEGVTMVGLLVSREGLSGRAVVRWSVSGNDVTADDVQDLSGTVVLETGMSEVLINIGIKADDIPELTESVVVNLDSIEPSNTQRLRPGATSIVIDVLSNDNPGGVIQFSPQMAASFEIEVSLV
ncbi:G-protein coupled receptor 98 [Elysia marginata]|uniref:G-protein coupled receptor 98 n=1 Tax=Elysia marginata TaxID=1093978 RepID=A0AAV4EH65_9GAST|nr:G-protein coupled receptor 98 [Elysia marginata]